MVPESIHLTLVVSPDILITDGIFGKDSGACRCVTVRNRLRAMSKRKNQHYVPQYYFRLFSTDKKRICLWNVRRACPFLGVPFRHQCAEDNYYGGKDAEEGYRLIDDAHARVIHHVVATRSLRSLGPDDKLLLCSAICLQRTRTKLARDSQLDVMNYFTRLQAECALNRLPKSDPRQVARQHLDDLSIEPRYLQRIQVVQGLLGAHLINDLEFVLIENTSRNPFVFSDAPVVLHNQAFHHIKYLGNNGIQSQGLQIFFPLCPELLILAYDPAYYAIDHDKEYKVLLAGRDDVRKINVLQYYHCLDNVYFRDAHHTSYVASLHARHRDRRQTRKAVLEVGPGRTSNGTPIGDILHAYTPPIPFAFSLSFLKQTRKVDKIRSAASVRNMRLCQMHESRMARMVWPDDAPAGANPRS